MTCYICGCEIRSGYYEDCWGRCICASHLSDGSVSRCSSCYGFALTRTALPDGRIYCSECSKNAIFMNDDNNITPVLNYTLKNLKRFGFDNLKMENVTIQIVSHDEIMRLTGRTGNDCRVLGLACTSYGGGEFRHKIYMLSHQNRTQFTATLAHELLHAWQYQNYIDAPDEICEGISNLGAFYVLSTIKTDLAKVLIKVMKERPDHIYGQGFRDVYADCSRVGRPKYFEFIKKKYKL